MNKNCVLSSDSMILKKKCMNFSSADEDACCGVGSAKVGLW